MHLPRQQLHPGLVSRAIEHADGRRIAGKGLGSEGINNMKNRAHVGRPYEAPALEIWPAACEATSARPGTGHGSTALTNPTARASTAVHTRRMACEVA
jgi:hypothetical protein